MGPHKLVSELQKAIFLSLLKLLELRFGEAKKYMNYVKFQITTNCINPKFHINAFFFSHVRGVTGYCHDICIIYP